VVGQTEHMKAYEVSGFVGLAPNVIDSNSGLKSFIYQLNKNTK